MNNIQTDRQSDNEGINIQTETTLLQTLKTGIQTEIIRMTGIHTDRCIIRRDNILTDIKAGNTADKQNDRITYRQTIRQ